ncbi:hypothetical protein ABEY43_06885 [Priestia megaterium]
MKEILEQFTNTIEKLDNIENGLERLEGQFEKILDKVDNIEKKLK